MRPENVAKRRATLLRNAMAMFEISAIPATREEQDAIISRYFSVKSELKWDQRRAKILENARKK